MGYDKILTLVQLFLDPDQLPATTQLRRCPLRVPVLEQEGVRVRLQVLGDLLLLLQLQPRREAAPAHQLQPHRAGPARHLPWRAQGEGIDENNKKTMKNICF